jgi:hypothetical protein
MSLVLLRGKADSALSNPCFMTPPSDFTTFEFPISNYFNFQNFVRSRRDSVVGVGYVDVLCISVGLWQSRVIFILKMPFAIKYVLSC